MTVLLPLALVVLGYLAGSLSFAIIVTRAVAGTDIRDLGNENAGTANVARSVGRGYATVVFFADIVKAILPMLLARSLLGADDAYSHFVVVLVGMAAVLGHCRPLYFGFRGGGGIATTFGAIAFVTPVELVFSMLAGFAVARILIRTPEYRLGRWTSGFIVLITPVVVTLSTFLLDIPIAGAYRIGGYQWYVLVGTWLAIGFVIYMNSRLYGAYIRTLFGRKADR